MLRDINTYNRRFSGEPRAVIKLYFTYIIIIEIFLKISFYEGFGLFEGSANCIASPMVWILLRWRPYLCLSHANPHTAAYRSPLPIVTVGYPPWGRLRAPWFSGWYFRFALSLRLPEYHVPFVYRRSCLSRQPPVFRPYCCLELNFCRTCVYSYSNESFEVSK